MLLIAVVVPCYRVRNHIMDVLSRIEPECSAIYVIDDKCPEGTGEFVRSACRDPRVTVIMHPENQGVGGATMTGYRQAVCDGAEVVVKIDGDGQMDPSLITSFVRPIIDGVADYTKGNRFYHVGNMQTMPWLRMLGNSVLSFMSKLSTGYWDIFDPTNGFTAIHARIIQALPMHKISRRYFFESDMLFRLNSLGAVVMDIPMPAHYGDEKSNLHPGKAIGEFAWKHSVNLLKRIVYAYFLRDFNFATIELVLGLFLSVLGTTVGVWGFLRGMADGTPATSGTVMLAALPVILGMQMLLGFLNYDMHRPTRPVLHLRLSNREPFPSSRG